MLPVFYASIFAALCLCAQAASSMDQYGMMFQPSSLLDLDYLAYMVDSDGNTQVQEQPAKVDCLWADWDDWRECSEACGGGYQIRTRSVARRAAFGGAGCPHEAISSRKCNTEPCKSGPPPKPLPYAASSVDFVGVRIVPTTNTTTRLTTTARVAVLDSVVTTTSAPRVVIPNATRIANLSNSTSVFNFTWPKAPIDIGLESTTTEEPVPYLEVDNETLTSTTATTTTTTATTLPATTTAAPSTAAPTTAAATTAATTKAPVKATTTAAESRQLQAKSTAVAADKQQSGTPPFASFAPVIAMLIASYLTL